MIDTIIIEHLVKDPLKFISCVCGHTSIRLFEIFGLNIFWRQSYNQADSANKKAGAGLASADGRSASPHNFYLSDMLCCTHSSRSNSGIVAVLSGKKVHTVVFKGLVAHEQSPWEQGVHLTEENDLWSL